MVLWLIVFSCKGLEIFKIYDIDLVFMFILYREVCFVGILENGNKIEFGF